MKPAFVLRLTFALASLALLLTGCSRDPNVLKHKYLESGQRYFAKGKYQEAQIQFENAVQVDPGFSEAHYQLFLAYRQLQKWPQAYAELSRTLEIDPQNYQAQIDMANLLILARKSEPDAIARAKGYVDSLLAKQPDNPLAHEAAANLLVAQDNIPGAIQEMKKTISLAPDKWTNYLNLAMLERSGQPDAAEANFKKAAELNPHAADPLLALGAFYMERAELIRKTGQQLPPGSPAEAKTKEAVTTLLGEAEQQFRHAIQTDPKSVEARAALIRLFLLQGRKNETQQLAEQTKHDLPENSEAYRMLGDFYFATGDLDKATAEYTALYQSHPKDLQVQKNYIQLLILKKRFDEASKVNDTILKASPNDVEGLIYRGQIQIGTGHANEATQTLQAALKNDPDNAIAHYHLGLAFSQLGDLARAEAEWREAVRLNPDSIEAHRALAACAIRKRDMDGLQQSADEIIRLQPASPDGYALSAIANINRKQFERAEADANRAVQVAPQSPVGYIQVGNLRLTQRQFPEAQKAYEQALERDPKDSDALNGLMSTYLVQKQVDKAVETANAQIAKVPDSSAFYDLLGTVLLDFKKDPNGAEAAFKKACELDRNNADALIKLGRVQVQKGATDEAIATYQRSLKDNPSEPTLYILLGELYESKRDWENAKQAYRKALDLKPDDPTASNNLAYVMIETGGNVDVALSLAQTARRGLPDSPNAADTLGWAFYQKGAYRSAIDLFQEAIRLAGKSKLPDDPTFYYHLGLAYQKNDQPALARQQFERVLKIAPDYSAAADVRKALSQLRS